MSRAFILSLSILLACNPCEIEFVSDTAVSDTAVIAPQSCAPETSDGDSVGESTSTSDSPSSTTYDVCEVQPGEVWGPCLPGFACAGVDVFCMTGSAGAICTPACNGEQCDVSSCMAGSCLTNGVCAPTCDGDADCALVGTVCDKSLPFPFCVFPS